jgi:hypothetical protein
MSRHFLPVGNISEIEELGTSTSEHVQEAPQVHAFPPLVHSHVGHYTHENGVHDKDHDMSVREIAHITRLSATCADLVGALRAVAFTLGTCAASTFWSALAGSSERRQESYEERDLPTCNCSDRCTWWVRS